MILGAAQWRENKQKSKDPGFARRPGQTKKMEHLDQAIRVKRNKYFHVECGLRYIRGNCCYWLRGITVQKVGLNSTALL